MPAGAAQRHGVGDAVAADRQRIDDRAAALSCGVAALGELGRRRVDRAGHPLHGVAAEGQGLGVVAGLEDHDAGVGPGGRRGQVVRAVAAQRDAAVGAARGGVLAAGVEDHHARAADAGVAGDREAAALDDVARSAPIVTTALPEAVKPPPWMT